MQVFIDMADESIFAYKAANVFLLSASIDGIVLYSSKSVSN
jgi:hypothetical protein